MIFVESASPSVLGQRANFDIKANILVDDDGHARLADFGLTFFADATVATHSTRNRGGSLRWMSPELHNPALFGFPFQRTCPSDIYAFACVRVV